jgi:hypothetical protein
MSNDIIITNYVDNNEDGIKKFETCQHRSENEIIKPSCCSAGMISGFRCKLKNLYPVSFSADCKNCLDYSKLL